MPRTISRRGRRQAESGKTGAALYASIGAGLRPAAGRSWEKGKQADEQHRGRLVFPPPRPPPARSAGPMDAAGRAFSVRLCVLCGSVLIFSGISTDEILYSAIDQTVPGTTGGLVHVAAVAEGSRRSGTR